MKIIKNLVAFDHKWSEDLSADVEKIQTQADVADR